ncbi:MAG: glutamate--cysteine ligase [Thermodesulfobacteriota bacterium]
MITEIQKLINEKQSDVLRWIENKKKAVEMPIYSSYDIRDNGVKAAIVDSNLFPGGFNNLEKESRVAASKLLKEFISKIIDSNDILVIPEAHTRNRHYLSNLFTIRCMLTRAGFKVTLGTVRDDVDDVLEVKDAKGNRFLLERMENRDGNLVTKSFKGGFILLNNDFSVAEPSLLNEVRDPIRPLVKLGWMHRKKFNHFKHYCNLVEEFAKFMNIDPWFFCPESREVNDVDFRSGKNIGKIAMEVDKILPFLKEKYEQYNIKEEPFVFVKDNSGTYGMGVMAVNSGKDVLELNSRKRGKMATGKQRSKINSVIIQEGIATRFRMEKGNAESVLYAVGGKVVGGFMRSHYQKDERSSLSAPGVKFDTLLEAEVTLPIVDQKKNEGDIGLYEVIADIASIAIGREMAEVM